MHFLWDKHPQRLRLSLWYGHVTLVRGLLILIAVNWHEYPLSFSWCAPLLTYVYPHSCQTWGKCPVLAKTFAQQSCEFSKFTLSSPKIKLYTSLTLPVIFSPSTIFITFFYRSLAGFLFKLSLRQWKLEEVLDFCIWLLHDVYQACITEFAKLVWHHCPHCRPRYRRQYTPASYVYR